MVWVMGLLIVFGLLAFMLLHWRGTPLGLSVNRDNATPGRTLQIFSFELPLSPSNQYPVWRVVLAALLPVAWWLLITLLQGQPVREPFIQMLLPVLLASWWGGLYAGLAASILALIGGWDLATDSPLMNWSSQTAPVNIFSVMALLLLGLLMTFSHEAICLRAARLWVSLKQARDAEQRLVSQVPASLAMFDTEMRYLAASARWKISHGLAMDADLTGVSHYEVFPNMPEQSKVMHQQALAGETLAGHEERFKGPNGKVQIVNWQCKPWRAPDGAIGGVIMWSEDVTQVVEERNVAETALREIEEKFRAALAESAIGFALGDAGSGEIVTANARLPSLLGYTEAELVGRKFMDLLHPDDAAEQLEQMRQLKAGQISSFVIENRYLHRDGHPLWVRKSVAAIRDPAGEIRWFAALSEDISSRREAETELQRTRDVLIAVQRIAQLGSFEYFPRMNRLEWSAEEKLIHGLDPDGPSPTFEAVVALILPEDRAGALAAVEKLLKSNGIGSWDYRIVRPDGSLRFMSTRAECKLDEKGELQRVIGTTQDLTGRKSAEEDLKSALAERTTLLDEVHHRVKNNLAVLTGLLWLQQQQTKNTEVIEQLQVSRDRIAAIALVHEQLYKGEHFDRIDFKKYLDQLCQSVIDSSGAGTRQISYRVTGENFPLKLTEAVPCSLLVNELVSNALKHAFPGERPGLMWIELSVGSDESRLVRVGDDGVGISQRVKRDDSLGLKLVNRLAKQLGARLELEATTVGTLYSLRLPSEKRSA